MQSKWWKSSFQLREGWDNNLCSGQATSKSCVQFWGYIRGDVAEVLKDVLGKKPARMGMGLETILNP